MNNLQNWLKEISDKIDAKDAKGFSEFITENGQFRFGNAEAVAGRKAIEDYVAYFFTMIGSSKHSIVNAWQNDDYITWQGIVHYTRLDGKEVDVNFVNIFKMEEDLISEYLIYIDNTPLFA
jgi:hypothetical protein